MLDNHPKLKSFLHYLLVHPYTSRPRWWARTFIIPFVIKRGKGSIIRRKARLDIIPSKKIIIGKKALLKIIQSSIMAWEISLLEITHMLLPE